MQSSPTDVDMTQNPAMLEEAIKMAVDHKGSVEVAKRLGGAMGYVSLT